MYDKLLKVTAILTGVLCCAAVCVVFYLASVKTIVIAEDITAGTGMSQMAEKELQVKQGVSGGVLRIPLPEGIRPDDIVIENRYVDHIINILITGEQEVFYEENALHGSKDKIEYGSYSIVDGVTRLTFELNGLYEHKYKFENNSLYLEFVAPRELYDKIVVIDAAHGGADYGCSVKGTTEKEITLDIVERLRKKLETTDIRAYYTRVDDSNPDLMQRAELANQARADMLISVHVNADEADPGAYGTLTRYNEEYVIPLFGNVELADILERQVVTAIDGRAIGLEKMKEDEILIYVEVPAASIEVGYLTNATDAALLEKEDYRERIADGILRAILEAYQKEEAVMQREW